MKPQRQRNLRPRRSKILIQCEGQATEPNYLEAFCGTFDGRERFTVTVKGGEGKVATATINAAIQERNRQQQRGEGYEEVWCVLDVEDASRRDNLNQAVQTAQREGFTLFLSNPSFEVWLLAHFERTSRHFQDSKQVEAHLEQRHWRPEFKCGYDKNDRHLFAKLAERLTAAVTNAETVLEKDHSSSACQNANSSTEVYRLIRKLRP